MKVIYALFDDGNQSVKKALEPLGYKVYSFGIQKKDTVIYTDLTDLDSFFEVIKDLPKPDYIFANPPCETFSNASLATYPSGQTGNLYYYIDGTPINDFYDWVNSTAANIKRMKRDKKEYFENLKIKRNISELLHSNTEKIVKYFNVPFIIENPRTSYTWKMNFKDFEKSSTNYNNYDESFSKKPTTFANNFGLVLSQENKKSNFRTSVEIRGYDKRSAVPESLILDIFKQMKGV